MFAYQNTIPQYHTPVFIPKVTPSNSELSVSLYNTYRSFVMSMMPLTENEVYYKVFNNADNGGVVGYGIHEKFIHHGMSIVDLSVGELDFPWSAAEVYQNSEVHVSQLVFLANHEKDPIVAGRLRQIAQFVQSKPAYTRLYYYRSSTGVKSVTIVDAPNDVKMNVVISWKI